MLLCRRVVGQAQLRTAHLERNNGKKEQPLLFLCIIFYCYTFILIVMYALFCIFRFHRASWQSSATLTEVFPCFFPQL